MSSTKDWLFEVEAERREKWMRETYNIPEDMEIEEDTPEWNEMAKEYANMLDGEQSDWEEKQQNEYNQRKHWYEQHPYESIYASLVTQRLHLKQMIEKDEESFDSHTIHKMAFVHSVTLLEAMIGDMIKALIVKHRHLMKRMALNIDEFNANKKYTVKEIVELQDGIDGIVMIALSKVSYHNLVTAKKLLVGLFGPVMNDLELNLIIPIVDKRHDFVHRNGKTTNDVFVVITKDILLDDMVTIDNFAHEVYKRIAVGMSFEQNNDGVVPLL